MIQTPASSNIDYALMWIVFLFQWLQVNLISWYSNNTYLKFLNKINFNRKHITQIRRNNYNFKLVLWIVTRYIRTLCTCTFTHRSDIWCKIILIKIPRPNASLSTRMSHKFSNRNKHVYWLSKDCEKVNVQSQICVNYSCCKINLKR